MNKASLPPLADIVILVLKHIDPDVDTSDIETLKAHAMAESAESNAAVNADIPPYNTIHTKAATCAMDAFSHQREPDRHFKGHMHVDASMRLPGARAHATLLARLRQR